jgi:hypothetical protein
MIAAISIAQGNELAICACPAPLGFEIIANVTIVPSQNIVSLGGKVHGSRFLIFTM